MKKSAPLHTGNASSKPKPLKDAYRHIPYNAKGKAKSTSTDDSDAEKDDGHKNKYNKNNKNKQNRKNKPRITINMNQVHGNAIPMDETVLSDGIGNIKMHDALVDSGSDSTVLNNDSFFNYVLPCSINVVSIHGSSTSLIKGYGPVTLSIDNVTFHIPRAYYAPKSNQNIISFDDLHAAFNCSLQGDHLLLQTPHKAIKVKYNHKRGHILISNTTFAYHVSIGEVWQPKIGTTIKHDHAPHDQP
ncbi:hypothetical protein SeLEV6574_g05661 [Synchytrium endobioticum]|uniref:Retrovirus-related Pol polyprotein from transposon TNT 1-94-like beta-barrel domain-containing protein n=1 Tax=Synchytrium endobioticum TaxID=286115 RepID=A0A507CTA4_9FUNG|nr:hypothetical protein SeLEV6574_g05661 [Synchytrium endobioticum]